MCLHKRTLRLQWQPGVAACSPGRLIIPGPDWEAYGIRKMEACPELDTGVWWVGDSLGVRAESANLGHLGVLRGFVIALHTHRDRWWGFVDLGQRLFFAAFRRTPALHLPSIHFLSNRPPGFFV